MSVAGTGLIESLAWIIDFCSRSGADREHDERLIHCFPAEAAQDMHGVELMVLSQQARLCSPKCSIRLRKKAKSNALDLKCFLKGLETSNISGDRVPKKWVQKRSGQVYFYIVKKAEILKKVQQTTCLPLRRPAVPPGKYCA